MLKRNNLQYSNNGENTNLTDHVVKKQENPVRAVDSLYDNGQDT